MKALTIVIVLALFVAGAGGGYWYLTQVRGQQSPAEATPAAGGTAAQGEPVAHGTFPQIPPGAEMCAVHRVPEIVCPFCNKEFVENAGFCGGHDVPEGLCTRCHPILIAAFKAEGDWCQEHGLPESQCLVCNPPAGG